MVINDVTTSALWPRTFNNNNYYHYYWSSLGTFETMYLWSFLDLKKSQMTRQNTRLSLDFLTSQVRNDNS